MEKLEIQFTNHKTFQWHIFISGSDDQIREKILNNNFIGELVKSRQISYGPMIKHVRKNVIRN